MRAGTEGVHVMIHQQEAESTLDTKESSGTSRPAPINTPSRWGTITQAYEALGTTHGLTPHSVINSQEQLPFCKLPVGKCCPLARFILFNLCENYSNHLYSILRDAYIHESLLLGCSSHSLSSVLYPMNL